MSALTGERWKPRRTSVDSWSLRHLQCFQDTGLQAMCSSRYHIEVPSECLHTWWKGNADETCYPNLLCNVKLEQRIAEAECTECDGFTDCFGMVETSLIMTTWRPCWPRRRSNQWSIQLQQLSMSATFSNSGLECLIWVFNSLLCSLDGGQTLTVASQDWKSRFGYSAVHVDLPTPSTQSETDPGKHTSRRSRMTWWLQSWKKQEFLTYSCRRRSPECRCSQKPTTMTTLKWLRSHQAMKRWMKLMNLMRRPRRLRRGALEQNKLQEKPMPELVTSRLRRRKMAWGDNLQKRRSAEPRCVTSVIVLRSWFQMHWMFNIVSFVVEDMALTNVLHQMMRTWRTPYGAWGWSWIRSPNPHHHPKDPKLQPEAEKTSSQRTSCHEESVGEEPDSLRKRKWPSASTVSQPLCTTLVIVKKEDNT